MDDRVFFRIDIEGVQCHVPKGMASVIVGIEIKLCFGLPVTEGQVKGLDTETLDPLGQEAIILFFRFKGIYFTAFFRTVFRKVSLVRPGNNNRIAFFKDGIEYPYGFWFVSFLIQFGFPRFFCSSSGSSFFRRVLTRFVNS